MGPFYFYLYSLIPRFAKVAVFEWCCSLESSCKVWWHTRVILCRSQLRPDFITAWLQVISSSPIIVSLRGCTQEFMKKPF